MTDLPVLDTRPLKDLLEMGATPALVQELIALFEEDVPVRLALLRTAIGSANAGETMAEAHQLKGALGNLGLLRFADLAARMEALARAGHLEEVPRLAEGLSAAYEDARAALAQAFPAE